MTDPTRRACRDLLIRACAALETPDDLDGEARALLIEDLTVAVTMAVPDPGLVEVALIDSGDPGPEQGRYCVLSTAHLSHATSEWLERWSLGPPPPPVAVATTFHGWFVSTREPEIPAEPLPPDIVAAMRFGRARGFDHLLFDSDAAQVEELDVHDW